MHARTCQATTPDSPSSGGSIYNKGIVRLRGGATFADNFVHGYYYDEEDEEEEEAEQGTGGDGGALWNGGRYDVRCKITFFVTGCGCGRCTITFFIMDVCV